MKTIRTALIGLGNVGRNFLKILESKSKQLATQYELRFQIVCVADSSGVAVNLAGFDPAMLRQQKEQGGKVSGLSGYQAQKTPAQVLEQLECDLVLEASPVNLQTGEPGLSAVRTALGRGIHCVLANKGPMVLAFQELHELAQQNHAGLAFSATVCGSLPVLNIGRRDLVAAEITLLRGIFNSTTNYILGEMEKGRSYVEALKEAQSAGIAETDPTLDVEGWDTANKLVIITNSVLGAKVILSDVTVRGITRISAEQLQQELQRGNTIKLVAIARLLPSSSHHPTTPPHYRLTVEPTILPQSDFLARCAGFEMGVEIHSDLYGIHFYKNLEGDALPTAAAMLRDSVNLVR
ncbi:MAG: homoserine dehydrogenase [Caldilineaceae bacterium]